MDWRLKSTEVRENLINYLRSIEPKGQYVTISKASKTPPQRRYFHAICNMLDDETGNKRDYHKTLYKFQVLPLDTMYLPNGQAVLYPLSSEKATIKEYGQMIDLALADCYQLGVTPPDAKHHGLDTEGKQ